MPPETAPPSEPAPVTVTAAQRYYDEQRARRNRVVEVTDAELDRKIADLMDELSDRAGHGPVEALRNAVWLRHGVTL